MTGNQRRSGFRLPWLADAESEGAGAAAGQTATTPDASADAMAAQADPLAGDAVSTDATEAGERVEAATEQTAPAAGASLASGAEGEASPDFMRELVAAMRRVAEGTRDTTLTDLRARLDARVKLLEAEAQRRQEDLRTRADADIAGVGEWARDEAERIKAEAEQRVTARRAQLEQQLADDAARNDAEAKAVRDRVNEYERELGAYYAQLAEITDPAAFAAAAKRMPRPPEFAAPTTSGGVTAPAPENGSGEAPAPGMTSNGTHPPASEVHPAEEEVLAARLAELDAALPAEDEPTAAPDEAGNAGPGVTAGEAGEPATTDVVVKGLGSFGAITSFRQVLAGVDGVDSVALSLGQSGEFVFRATHRPGFDVGAAIVTLEGDAARVEPRDKGGLLVTLERAR